MVKPPFLLSSGGFINERRYYMSEPECNSCHAKLISEESLFCHKCGAKITATKTNLNEPSIETEISNDSPVHLKKSNFLIDFEKNYYRVPYIPSVLFMIFAIVYAASPIDLISSAPLISWLDDVLLLLCAAINLLHLGIAESDHTKNIVFKRIKLILFPLCACIVFFMWFAVSIVLILFGK